MSSFLSGGKGRANTPNNPDYKLRISTSVLGQAIPIVWGQQRIAPNCLSYKNFGGYWSPTSSGKGGGGKSGGGGGKGGGGGNGQWNYFANVVWSLCEGPIAEVKAVIENSTYHPWPSPWVPVVKNCSSYSGNYTQNPPLDLKYRGNALIAGPCALGSSSALPNLSFDVLSTLPAGIPALGPDVNPADVIEDFFTNSDYGVPSFQTSYLGDLTPLRDYCTSLGLVVSYTLHSPIAASQFVMDMCKAVNCEPVFSSGALTFLPYTDHAVSGNGASYDPGFTPIYDLTIDDFCNVGDSGDSPILIEIKDETQMVNHVRVEYLSRAKHYNADIVDAVDEAAIAFYGTERRSDTISAHMFAIQSAAKQSASLMLARAKIARTFKFTIGRHFILLDPMDLVTLTEEQLGLVRQAVRITEIQENEDETLTITADEFMGRVTSPLYGQQASEGAVTDRNADPGAINAPVIFQPPYQLANALELWIALSGEDTSLYGGCNIYLSSDDTSYTFIGDLQGASQTGFSTNVLPSVTPASTGQTVDSANTLNVNLVESNATLTTTTSIDMLAGGTATYIDGEIIAFQNATLLSANNYGLTPMLRGAFGSPIGSHAIGSRVVRLGSGILKLPITSEQIGSTIYFKFQPLNLWGGFHQQLEDVGSVAYTIPGDALSGGLATPQNVRTVFEAGFMKIWWDEVVDFRPGVTYDIRQGTTFASSTSVGNVAHPPFIAFGEGTYWISATVTPIIGVTVKSTTPAAITLAGNMLVANVLIQKDEQAADWPLGTLTNLTVQGTTGGQYLTLDVGQTQGIYNIPSADIPDLGYIGTTAINVSWLASGAPVSADFFGVPDFFDQEDIFYSAASSAVNAWPEIRISDLAHGSGGYGAWQKFVPGNYYGRSFELRMVIECFDDTVTAALNNFKFTVSVAPRIDHYQNQSIAAGGTTITFQPDGAASAGAFNGGPNGATVPYINVSWSNTAGDVLSITALSLSSVNIQILNGGIGVARTGVNVTAEGY